MGYGSISLISLIRGGGPRPPPSDLNARRADGVVVYLNGAEIWRDNMPAGTISASTFAVGVTYSPGNFNLNNVYYPCTTCGPNLAQYLKVARGKEGVLRPPSISSSDV